MEQVILPPQRRFRPTTLAWKDFQFGARMCDYLIWQDAGNVAFSNTQARDLHEAFSKCSCAAAMSPVMELA